ncbi:carbonic anhydrase [Helicobacter muridarum]|uniref:carbonic anhydrase n=1 Tax=Helicobacter muridarum TaxID=216 RepID=A0A099U1K9_9HELI|nr:carbonic anhydrase [Helicobacter muridarum]TLE00852.1 carbonic anhydrase [Helicobacter muridarum]STQ86620.1 carbonic anhydrase [Helicobacter muridarum]
MRELFKGAIKFYEEDYNNEKNFFKSLQENKPHTLFITCVDSRIDPNRLTQSKPGELYVVRNIGNIIPPYSNSECGYLAVTSSIEYSICKLKVKNIIVCGHSNCGACAIVYENDKLDKMPYVKKWLELLEPTIEEVNNMQPEDKRKRTWLTELQNIQQQLHNLLSYPFVEERFNRGELNIYGWYYNITSGQVLNYNLIQREFKPIIGDKPLPN